MAQEDPIEDEVVTDDDSKVETEEETVEETAPSGKVSHSPSTR